MFLRSSTQLLINAARVLGKDDDVATYSVASKIKEAFLKEAQRPMEDWFQYTNGLCACIEF
jgi:hypothetical protein